jgi:hypothetical protein
MLQLRTAVSRMSDDIQSSAAGESSPAAYLKRPINRRSVVVAAAGAFVALLGLSAPIVMSVDPNFVARTMASSTVLQNLPFYTEVSNASGSCFTGASFTTAARP